MGFIGTLMLSVYERLARPETQNTHARAYEHYCVKSYIQFEVYRCVDEFERKNKDESYWSSLGLW